MQSLGIYISVPFCRSKCTYCNFASGVYPEALHREYIERLCLDMDSIGRTLEGSGAVIPRVVDSIYLGGGTPSLLSASLLHRLWQALRRNFEIVETAEVTLESAPGQLEDATLQAAVECGVNRVSFGVQSFVDREAAITGRLHTRQVALADLCRVRSAGIKRVNVDLIAGLPRQTAASWQESLEVLNSTGVDHASIYMLEVDDDSRLGRELISGGTHYHAQAVPGADLTADLYETAIQRLEDHGFEHYEISNFARPGCRSRHNEKYWRRQPYLGFGLDAHSMLRTSCGSVLRFQTADSLAGFLGSRQPFQSSPRLEGEVFEEITKLSPADEIEEAWFLGLRLLEGIAWRSLADEFGQTALDRFKPVVDQLCAQGLLTFEDGVVRLTRIGLMLSNEVFAQFLNVEELPSPVVFSG